MSFFEVFLSIFDVFLCICVVRRVRRRRRPPPSVAVVRRRRPLSVRPVRPSSSVVVAYLQIQGRMQIFKKKLRNGGREYEIRIELEI